MSFLYSFTTGLGFTMLSNFALSASEGFGALAAAGGVMGGVALGATYLTGLGAGVAAIGACYFIYGPIVQGIMSLF